MVNYAQRNKALQLERVARQYPAHRELQRHLDQSDLWEPYEDIDGHVQFFKVTPHTIFAERLIRRTLMEDLRDNELALSIADKFLLPGEKI